MTDQELEAWVAEVVMGWTKRSIEGVTGLQPTGVNVIWFTDFKSTGHPTWRINKEKIDPRYDPPLWHPLSNYNQIFGPGMVVEKMRELGWVVSIENTGDDELNYNYSCRFESANNPDIRYYATDLTLARAIILAAKAALTP